MESKLEYENEKKEENEEVNAGTGRWKRRWRVWKSIESE